MQGVPENVTMTQVRAAARALGLPIDSLIAFSANLHEVTAEVCLLDANGSKIAHNSRAVTATLHLSIDTE